MLTVFTGQSFYLGALPGQERTVVPVPRGGHLPFLGSPALPPLRLTGDFLPRRLDGTTAGR